jgi:hypothetical protein
MQAKDSVKKLMRAHHRKADIDDAALAAITAFAALDLVLNKTRYIVESITGTILKVCISVLGRQLFSHQPVN